MSEEKEALMLYQKSIVVDACNSSTFDDKYFRKIRDSGITATVVTPAVDENFRQAVERVNDWYSRIHKNSEKALLATSVENIKRAKKEGKTAILLGFQNIAPIEDDLRLLTIFHRLGVRSISLTYNDKNSVGDGCTERTNCGISDFGIEVIKEMNRLGILVDLSHVGEATSMDAMEFTKDPVVFTHSNARSLCDNPRNITDEQIKALAEHKGVIGVCAFPSFVSKKPNPTVEDLLDHVDYIAKLVGVDHVGFGLDLIEGSTREEHTTIAGKLGWGKTEFKLEAYPPWPWIYPKGIDEVSKFPNLVKGLIMKGYSDQEIEKILGGNFLRIFEKVFKY